MTALGWPRGHWWAPHVPLKQLRAPGTSPRSGAHLGVEVLEQRGRAGLGAGRRGQLVFGLDNPDGPQHHLLLVFLKQALLEELVHMETIVFQLLHTPEEEQVKL